MSKTTGALSPSLVWKSATHFVMHLLPPTGMEWNSSGHHILYNCSDLQPNFSLIFFTEALTFLYIDKTGVHDIIYLFILLLFYLLGVGGRKSNLISILECITVAL